MPLNSNFFLTVFDILPKKIFFTYIRNVITGIHVYLTFEIVILF